jgi:hypothetical protein
MRIVVAFLLAPLAPAVLAALLALVPAIANEVRPGSVLFAGAVYGYPIAAVFGIPSFLYFRSKGWLGFWQVSVAGAVCGALVPTGFLICALPFIFSNGASGAPLSEGLKFLAGLLVFGTVLGSVSAAAFWVLAFARTRGQASSVSGGGTSAA